MTQNLWSKRLANEYDDALEALEDEDQEKVDSSIKVIIPVTKNGLKDFSEWIVIFRGKQYTSLEEGNYKLKVKIGEKYPYEPPEVWCLDGFEHFHVFAGGKVCFKLLNKQNWKIWYTILLLINGIIKMLHSDPEISDPASTTLAKLVERGETKYHQPNTKPYHSFLKSQARRFKNRYVNEVRAFRKEMKLPLSDDEKKIEE